MKEGKCCRNNVLHGDVLLLAASVSITTPAPGWQPRRDSDITDRLCSQCSILSSVDKDVFVEATFLWHDLTQILTRVHDIQYSPVTAKRLSLFKTSHKIHDNLCISSLYAWSSRSHLNPTSLPQNYRKFVLFAVGCSLQSVSHILI